MPDTGSKLASMLTPAHRASRAAFGLVAFYRWMLGYLGRPEDR